VFRLTQAGHGRLFHSIPAESNFGNGGDCSNYVRRYVQVTLEAVKPGARAWRAGHSRPTLDHNSGPQQCVTHDLPKHFIRTITYDSKCHTSPAKLHTMKMRLVEFPGDKTAAARAGNPARSGVL
jgi:hypothetical protein